MQSTDAPVAEEERCQPQWMAHNHLFSFCTRTLPLQASGSGAKGKSPSPVPQQCSRRDCLFRAKTK